MPEGPEVETIRTSLEPLLVGRTLTRVWVSPVKLRVATQARAFDGLLNKRITALGRKGKLMWLQFTDARGVFVRLGMTGKLTVVADHAPRAPHTHVVLATDAHDVQLRYVDPRRFGAVVPFASTQERDLELSRIGPDGVSLHERQQDRVVVRAKLAATRRALKDVLLDQAVFAGVGNIYAAEALFVARLSPFALACHITDDEADALMHAVGQVLTQAVGRRGTSFNNYVDGLGVAGDNLKHLHVFQREGEPCRACGAPVARVVQGQRSTFFCAACQRVTRARRRKSATRR